MKRCKTLAIQIVILLPIIVICPFFLTFIFGDNLPAIRTVFAVCLLVPGGALGEAWRRCLDQTDRTTSRFWNALNVGSLVLMTIAYLLFVGAAVLIFTPWQDSFERLL